MDVCFFYGVGIYSIMLHGRVLVMRWDVVQHMGWYGIYTAQLGGWLAWERDAVRLLACTFI